MQVIKARNAHQALPEVMYQLKAGVRRESRNGSVLRLPGPATIVYERPWERVVFWAARDANPFFHLLEALWMLAGREDVAFPASLVGRMSEFSDDGEVFNGAYGFRWREHFGIDQLLTIAEALRENPDCRRQVLSMWDGHRDLGRASKDLPCNTHAYLSRDAEGCLDLMVCNRSNDAVWGALGANAVHFSMMQEFVAATIGCPIGRYWQVTNNLHLYLDHHAPLMECLAEYAYPEKRYYSTDYYAYFQVESQPLVGPGESPREVADDIVEFIHRPSKHRCRTAFLSGVAQPMYRAYGYHKQRKGGSNDRALRTAQKITAGDWRRAVVEWLKRRQLKQQTKEASQ